VPVEDHKPSVRLLSEALMLPQERGIVAGDPAWGCRKVCFPIPVRLSHGFGSILAAGGGAAQEAAGMGFQVACGV